MRDSVIETAAGTHVNSIEPLPTLTSQAEGEWPQHLLKETVFTSEPVIFLQVFVVGSHQAAKRHDYMCLLLLTNLQYSFFLSSIFHYIFFIFTGMMC